MSLRAAICSVLLSSTLASKIQSSGEVSKSRSSEALLIAINAEEEPQQDTASALTHLLATGSTTSATAGFNAVRSSLCQGYDSEHEMVTGNEENLVRACREKCGLVNAKADGHIQAFTVNRMNDKKSYCTCSSRGDCTDYLACPNCISYIMIEKFWPFSSDSEETTTTAAHNATEKAKEEPTTAAPNAEEKAKEEPTTAAPNAEEKVKEEPTTAAPHAEEKVKEEPTTAAPHAEGEVKEAPTTAAAAEEKEHSTTTAPDAEEKTAKATTTEATTTEASTTVAETTSAEKESTHAEASSFVNEKTHLRHKKNHKKHHGKAHHKKHASKDSKKKNSK